MYRCETRSVSGFVQQLSVSYIRQGYFFYVAGLVPLSKDPRRTDQRIIEKYHLLLSKYSRCRRKKKGIASVQYLRYRHFFVIVATAGAHDFFQKETDIKDVRREPIKFGGYSIGYRQEKGGAKWHVSIRIEKWWVRELKAFFIRAATRKTEFELAELLRNVPFEPYAPVQRQVFGILRRVNEIRRIAGLPVVPREALYRKRRPVKPFEDP